MELGLLQRTGDCCDLLSLGTFISQCFPKGEPCVHLEFHTPLDPEGLKVLKEQDRCYFTVPPPVTDSPIIFESAGPAKAVVSADCDPNAGVPPSQNNLCCSHVCVQLTLGCSSIRFWLLDIIPLRYHALDIIHWVKYHPLDIISKCWTGKVIVFSAPFGHFWKFHLKSLLLPAFVIWAMSFLILKWQGNTNNSSPLIVLKFSFVLSDKVVRYI